MSKALLTRLKNGLSETTLAYVAGVIEGDGTISLSGLADVTVAVTNGNLRLLEWLERSIGGYIVEKSSLSQIGRSPQFQWKVRHSDGARFCRLILPYLVGKKRQAELVVEGLDLKRQFRGRKPALIRRRLTEIGEECRWWNRQGWRADNTEEVPEHDSVPAQMELVK